MHDLKYLCLSFSSAFIMNGINMLNNSINVIDVGARGGAKFIIPREELKNEFSPYEDIFKLVGFEPDENAANNLNYEHVFKFAAGERKCNAQLYLTKNRGCSSTLEPDKEALKKFLNDKNHAESYSVEKKISVPMSTIDFELEKINFRPDLLKIDVQGGELEVLYGAHNALKDVSVINVELTNVRQYKKQKLGHEVMAYLFEHGFDLVQVYYKQNLAREYDAIFMKPDFFITNRHQALACAIFSSICNYPQMIHHYFKTTMPRFYSDEEIRLIRLDMKKRRDKSISRKH